MLPARIPEERLKGDLNKRRLVRIDRKSCHATGSVHRVLKGCDRYYRIDSHMPSILENYLKHGLPTGVYNLYCLVRIVRVQTRGSVCAVTDYVDCLTANASTNRDVYTKNFA